MTGQLDDSLTIDNSLRFTQRSLNDELIQRRTNLVRSMLKSVLYVLRHPGRNSASFVREFRSH